MWAVVAKIAAQIILLVLEKIIDPSGRKKNEFDKQSEKDREDFEMAEAIARGDSSFVSYELTRLVHKFEEARKNRPSER